MRSLTKPERETVISFSDADSLAHIWTAQRPVITKLKANGSAKLLQEGFIGSTAWAEFELPAAFVSFRRGRNKLSAEDRAKRAERMRAVVASR